MERRLLIRAGWDPGTPFLKRSEFFELLHDMSRIAGKPVLKIPHGQILATMMLCFWQQDHPDWPVKWNSPQMTDYLRLFLKALFEDHSISFFDPAEPILPAEELYDRNASAFLDSRLHRTYATGRASEFEIVPFPDNDSGKRFVPLNGLAWAVNARQTFAQIRSAGNYIAEYEAHLRRWQEDPEYDIFTVQSISRCFHSGSCCLPFGVSEKHSSFYRELFSIGEFENNEADWEKTVVSEYVERLLQLPKRNNPEIWLSAFAHLN